MIEVLVEPRPAWLAAAACRGRPTLTSDFIPDRESNRRVNRNRPPLAVIELCSVCPVAAECLQRSMDSGSSGWHGGVLLRSGVSVSRKRRRSDQAAA
jgi:Transcription factor WhiB